MSPHHMTNRRRRPLAHVVAGIACAALGASVALAPSTAQAAVSDSGGTPTQFGMKANGYGTSVRGGQIPLDSERTGLAVTACTTLAGEGSRNFVTEAQLPEDVATVRGVTSHNRTLRRPKEGIVETVATEKVAEIVLAQTDLGTLSIQGLRSTARAIHGPDGFSGVTDNQIGRIVLTPAAGDPMEFEIPDADTPITIPGLATIELGRNAKNVTSEHSFVYSAAAKITLLATGTVIHVARSTAQMQVGAPVGAFRGSASAIKGRVLGDLVKVGRVVNQVMPCAGTDDAKQVDGAADTTDMLNSQGLSVDAATLWQRSKQTDLQAHGTENAELNGLTIGPLTIDVAKASVHVTKHADGTLERTATTRILGATMDGEEMSAEDLDGQVVEIPGGLAKIETGLVQRYPDGIQAIPLRVTLLDGTDVDSVVDLGIARLAIVP
ncbi:choice-of-anchor P family protein [Nocardioides sp. GY 10127]|uniref:choice-of-anchor P family protein n=1 Tax=Nocardioides sp. GY 10127 TaxID=2569762 RepID=UPI0010A930A9|nr:choice-of-anchor P family protein [Nocardioides sp. GY 10127]TIC82942.1 hypothetical protein E8D37_09860 [Nocardioides sp. GY 10127]